MKRALKHKSTIYEYLDNKGVLTNGTIEDIDAAKKEYWRLYKNDWRKKHRAQTRQVVVVLTAHQAKVVAAAAKAHSRSLQRFILEACLAYISKKYLPIDPVAVASIRQLLIMNYDALQRLFTEQLSYNVGKTVLNRMDELEKRILTELYNPKQKQEH